MIDEQDFRRYADEAMSALYRRLTAASDKHDFEADFNAGTLAIEFEEPPAKFVISPNTPVRQLWVSAQSKSFKLDWNESRQAFVLPDKDKTLDELIGEAISDQLGEEVTL